MMRNAIAHIRKPHKDFLLLTAAVDASMKYYVCYLCEFAAIMI